MYYLVIDKRVDIQPERSKKARIREKQSPEQPRGLMQNWESYGPVLGLVQAKTSGGSVARWPTPATSLALAMTLCLITGCDEYQAAQPKLSLPQRPLVQTSWLAISVMRGLPQRCGANTEPGFHT